jgi:hypothetical protein
LTWSSDNTALLWNSATGEQLAQMRHGGDVIGAAYSPDGKRILTWADENAVRLWDANTGKETAVLPHPDLRNRGSFYGDGAQVVTWSGDGAIRLWNATNGSEVRQFRHKSGINQVAVSPDGLRLLADPNSDDVQLWDASTGDLLAAGTESVTKRVLAPDAKHVLTWPGGPSAHLWSLWSPVAVLAQRASTIAARLHPLSRIDRCQAHLDSENCESIGSSSERDLALAGDEQRRRPASPNANSLTTMSTSNYLLDDTKFELVLNDMGEVFVFHNKPFASELKRIEYNRLTKTMNFIVNDRPRNFGMPVDPKLAKYFETASRVLVVLMNEKTGEPIEGNYRPVIIY